MTSPRVMLPVLLAIIVSSSASSQQSVPMRNNIPVAPSGLTVPPLPDVPRIYATAEGQDILVRVLVRGIENPWSIAFLPDGDLLVTERTGQLRRVSNGQLVTEPVAGVPEVAARGLSGLMDVVLHPDFADNRYVYLSYFKPLDEERATLAVARGRWDGNRLTNTRDIIVVDPATGGGSRLAFDHNNKLYMGTGGNGAQDPMTLAGKVLRLNDDGSIPADNPFVGRSDYRPEIFTLGHRNQIGLAMHPGTGEIWQNENGPNGGDEINVLFAGANYGWPLISLGRTYPGPWQSEQFGASEFTSPIVYWTPSIALSGMAFYTGDALPKWKGDVFVGGLRKGEIPGTGRLERILFNENMEELRREALLTDLRQRIRDVRMGPDELLYVLTDAEDGAILRIEPVP